jgi:GNAT superfamily N-acetyltransferase
LAHDDSSRVLGVISPSPKLVDHEPMVEILPVDVRATAYVQEVERFLSASEEAYPGIVAWWRKRVMPEVGRGARVCDGAYAEGRLIGLCIGKLDAESAKLCSLRVDEAHRGRGLARSLLAPFVDAAHRTGAHRIHFTMGDGCEHEFGGYFQALGFSRRAWQRHRYRRGHDEHVFIAPTVQVRSALTTQS